MIPPSLLDQPLDSRNPAVVELLETVQGNIFKSHGRRYTRLVLFWFDDGVDGRRLRHLFSAATTTRDRTGQTYLVTTAARQQADADAAKRDGNKKRPFYSLGITLAGMKRCGYASDEESDEIPIQPPGTIFQEDGDDRAKGFGVPMNGDPDQSRIRLDDPPSDGTDGWDLAYQCGDGPHGVWLLANDDQATLDAMKHDIVGFLAQHDAGTVVIEDGFMWRDAEANEREPFGFRDVISQPEFFAGEDYEATSKWVRIPPSRAMIWRFDARGNANRHNGGSFLVLRKLEQNVKAFRAFEESIQREVDRAGQTADAGALLLGRARDGRALGVATGPGLNDFTFEESAAPGGAQARCPFHAHIRKANPREKRDEASNRRALFVRRSVIYDPYGQLPANGSLSDAAEPWLQPKSYERHGRPGGGVIEKDVGMLFMGYMCNISAQFVRMQNDWFANRTFPKMGTRFGDALVRPLGVAGAKWSWQPDAAVIEVQTIPAEEPQPVVTKGGAYFYVPSIPWLQAQWPSLPEP